jgi:diguanylate cyclase (GGDEF)-like protein/PAS domain S-box-containing protein
VSIQPAQDDLAHVASGATGDDVTRLICPVTGLSVLRRPEWHQVAFEPGFNITAEIIGGSILLTRNRGRATLEGVRKAFDFTEALIEAEMGGRPYIHILDYTHLDGTTLEGRRYFIHRMLERDHMAGVIFYGLSPMLRMSTKLGKRLNIIQIDVHIASHYFEAVRMACELLQKVAGIPPAALHSEGTAITHFCARDGSPHIILSHNDWEFEKEGYGIRLDVVDGHILRSASKGILRVQHLPDLIALRDRIYNSLADMHDPLYLIVGMRDLQGVERRARKYYIDAISAWHRKVPFQAYIIYGLNPFMAAVASFSKFTLPFNIHVAKDFDDALELVSRAKKTAPATRHREDQPPLRENRKPMDGAGEVEHLMEFIGRIDWERDGVALPEQIHKKSPLGPVYDAISVIKSEVDDLLREKIRTEEALCEARDKLDLRVRERTAELIATNRRLQNEIAERRDMEVALRASEKNYRDLVDSVNSIILRWDARGRIIFINPYGLKFFGHEAEALIGKNVVGTIVPESESISKRDLGHLMEQIRKDPDRFRNNENENVTRDGRRVWIYWTNRAITDDEGRIVEILSVGNDITGRRHMEAELRRLATTDPLTGAFNRRRFFQKARQEFLRHRRYGHRLAVLLMDMDHFKKINDTHGHPVGDAVLKAFVQTCLNVFRVTDIFGRTGGEEFSAVLPETDAENAARVAERLRDRVSRITLEKENGDTSIRFTVSIGLTGLQEDDLTLESMIRRADQALYTAKKTGRNRVVQA